MSHQIVPSMTESGNPKDNAMAERINSTIKNELLYRKTFTSQHQVKEAVDKAILFYNMERPHSSLDRLTPEQAHGMQGEMKRHWLTICCCYVAIRQRKIADSCQHLEVMPTPPI